MEIVKDAKFDDVNRVLASGHHWHFDDVGHGGLMLAVRPQVGRLDNEPSPYHGQAHLSFLDGERWRWPRVGKIEVGDDGTVSLEFLDWGFTGELKHYTIAVAADLGQTDLDPDNPEHLAMFESLLPRVGA